MTSQYIDMFHRLEGMRRNKNVAAAAADSFYLLSIPSGSLSKWFIIHRVCAGQGLL